MERSHLFSTLKVIQSHSLKLSTLVTREKLYYRLIRRVRLRLISNLRYPKRKRRSLKQQHKKIIWTTRQSPILVGNKLILGSEATTWKTKRAKTTPILCSALWIHFQIIRLTRGFQRHRLIGLKRKIYHQKAYQAKVSPLLFHILH